MLIINDCFKEHLKTKNAIALGGFDGIHIGHRALLDRTINQGKLIGGKAMVLTFKNHPLTMINPEFAPKLLMDNDDKIDFFDKYGIDILNLIEFNSDFMKNSAEDFVMNLKKYYNVSCIVVGYNFRFGYKNLGDVEFLRKLQNKYDFKLEVIKEIKYKGESVSSTRLRYMISEEGNVKKAIELLGRPFKLKGTVIHGRHIGQSINFPTVNIDYDKSYAIPRGGVYYTVVKVRDKFYKGMTNIGYNPTVHNNKLSIETHILDFQMDIYGDCIEILFMDRIRDELKFESLEGLKAQLLLDKKKIITNYKIYK